MEIMLADTKDAVGGSWIIVFVDDNVVCLLYEFNGFIIMDLIFYYHVFKRLPGPLTVSNSKSSVGGSAKLDFVLVFQGD